MTSDQVRRIQEWVVGRLTPSRLEHTRGVVRTAVQMARKHRLSVPKARLAAWLHDCAKCMTEDQMRSWMRRNRAGLDAQERALPELWHPHAGAFFAKKKWGIRDRSILEAIRCHTLGEPGMGRLAQLIFVADFIEPGRDFRGVREARRAALKDLRQGVLAKASMSLEYLLERKKSVHPRLLATWNHFLSKGRHDH